MWSKLEILYHIVKAGSLLKAAEILKTDQPTLTRKLATLEKKFGFKLINRSTPQKTLTLTEQGKIVFEAAQKTFVTTQTMETELFDNKSMKGKIRLSTNRAIADFIINPLLIEFGKKYPDINLELLCNDSLIDLYKNEVDFSIRLCTEEDPTLIQEPLFTLEAGLYASPDYLKKFGTPKTIEDLDTHRLIAFAHPKENPYSNTDWSLRLGREGQKKRTPFYTVNSMGSFWEAAEEGMGIIISYEHMLKRKKPNIVRILDNVKGPTYKLHLVYPKKLENVKRMQKLKELLMENL